MKIRLYRGPFDGKVIHMSGSLDSIVMMYRPKYKPGSKQWKKYWSEFGVYSNPTEPINEMSMMSQTVRYQRTRHTHPDGAVFYEWDQPRGTSVGH